MAQRRSILFLTNSDFGQANVVLAVAYELLLRNEFDVHIASWTPLESRVIELSKQVQNEVPNTTIHPIKFHTFPLKTMFDSYIKNIGEKKADLPHPPGANGAERLTQLAPNVLGAWEPEEHIEIYEWCADLARELNPSLVIVEPFLGPALDMAKTLKLKYAVLSPCTLASGLTPEQPWGAGFWKYPALSTGFRYPLPWSKIPENLYCTWAVIKCLWQPRVKKLNAARNAHGIYGPLPTLTPWVKDVPHVSPSLPEIDLPMVIPSNVHYCGPILLATTPISQSDPELLNWLQNKPTILLALGTHHEARADVVREIALGLRILLEARPDVQVLWKLKAEKQAEEDDKQTVNTILSKELAESRVRIEGWLKADPVAIMESGNIICSVHHGGANSYFGTCWAGIPQVILAPWYDTYDYAMRVEYLGIGVYGNDKAGHEAVIDMSNYKSPLMIDGEEFGAALLKAIGKEKGGAQAIRKRASELGEVCRKSGGRVQAAKIFNDLALNG